MSRDTHQRLSNIGAGFPIAKAVDNLRKTDCYAGWGEELRYFLHRYEEYLAQKAGQKFNNEQWNHIWESSAADSIEHIRPQSYWASIDVESPYDEIHRLGNLLILPPGLNSKLQDKSPGDKADEYGKTGLLVAQEVVGQLRDWDEESIVDRENALLQWALQEWAD